MEEPVTKPQQIEKVLIRYRICKKCTAEFSGRYCNLCKRLGQRQRRRKLTAIATSSAVGSDLKVHLKPEEAIYDTDTFRKKLPVLYGLDPKNPQQAMELFCIDCQETPIAARSCQEKTCFIYPHTFKNDKRGL